MDKDNEIGTFVVQSVKCTLNPDVKIRSKMFKKHIKVTFHYNGIDKSTEAAEVLNQDGKQVSRFHDEQVIFPIVKDKLDIIITVYDIRQPGYEGNLGEVTFCLNEKNGRVKLEISKNRAKRGEICFNISSLSIEAPSDDMTRIHTDGMIGKKIGMIFMENIKVKNLNGRSSYLELTLNSESNSTRRYWSTERDKELKVALPLICNPNPSLRVCVCFGVEKGVKDFFLIQFEDIWKRMISGGVANVGDQTIFSAGQICARLSFDISCRRIVKPDELFSEQGERVKLIDIDDDDDDSFPTPTDSSPLDDDVTDDGLSGESSGHIRPPQNDQFDGFDEPDETTGPEGPFRTSTYGSPPGLSMFTPEVPISSSPRNRSLSPTQSLSSVRTTTTNRTYDASPRIICQRFVVVSAHQRHPSNTTDHLRNRLSHGRHIYTSCDVIIKEVFTETSFHNEIKWLKELKSEWVVKWVDMDRSECVIITENHGSSLDSIYMRFRRSEDILNVYRSISEGLKFIHDHDVVHMDLCPSNIICKVKRGSGNRMDAEIRICDFEHSRQCGHHIQINSPYNSTHHGRSPSSDFQNQNQQAFTIGFTAPELLGITKDGLEEPTSSSISQHDDLYAEFSMDIFALSGIFYLLWVKRPMYKDLGELRMLLREEFSRVERDIGHEGVAKMVFKMSKGSPDDRCEIDDVMRSLRGLMGGHRRGTEDRSDWS